MSANFFTCIWLDLWVYRRIGSQKTWRYKNGPVFITDANIWHCWYRLPQYGTKTLHERYRIYYYCDYLVFQNKQGKSEGFDSYDRPSNLTQIGLNSSILQPVWHWNMMDDQKLGCDLCDLDLWPLTLIFCMDITSVIGNNSWKFHDDMMMGT